MQKWISNLRIVLTNFHKNMSLVFTKQKVYKNRKITPLSSHVVGEAWATNGVYGGTFNNSSTCTSQEEANEVTKMTNCSICRLPKGHAKSHILAQCQFTANMGLEVKYSEDTDQHHSNYDKKKLKATKAKAKDKADDKLDPNHGLVKKHDSNVTCLVDSLNVTDLDVDLFSYTRHDSNGECNTFFLGDGTMYLTFPTFTVTDDIPENGDLKVPIQPFTEDDWAEHT